MQWWSEATSKCPSEIFHAPNILCTAIQGCPAVSCASTGNVNQCSKCAGGTQGFHCCALPWLACALKPSLTYSMLVAGATIHNPQLSYHPLYIWWKWIHTERVYRWRECLISWPFLNVQIWLHSLWKWPCQGLIPPYHQIQFLPLLALGLTVVYFIYWQNF